MQLPGETRAILQKQIAQSQAYFDLESGRKFLTSGDYERAKDSLTKANKVLNRTKLKLVILGLRVAPLLTRWGMLTWQKFVRDQESQNQFKTCMPIDRKPGHNISRAIARNQGLGR